MASDDLARMRTEYARIGLEESAAGSDPIALARAWLSEAIAAGVHEPNAMALATATPGGVPSVRIVLMKGLDERGVVFYTGYDSRKGTELTANPRAAVVLLWHQMQRQVRIEGPVEQLTAAESDAYYLSRPEGARISAAASPQSQVVADRAELDRLWARAQAQGAADSRPEQWGGYRILAESVEFWQGRQDRLHDRIRYRRDGDDWVRERLAP